MKKKKNQKAGKKRKEKKPAKKKQEKKQFKDSLDPVKELEKLLTKPEKQKRTFVTEQIEMKTDLRKEIGAEDEELKDLISPKRSIDLKILRYLEELPKEQFTALLVVEPTNYSKINHELIRILLNHTQGIGLYVTLNRASDFLEETLKKEKIDTEKIFFVDAISSGSGKATKYKENVIYVESPRNLTGLSVAIDDAYKKVEEKPQFLIFDSISTLLIYNDINAVERFIHSIIGKLRDWKIKGVLLMVKSDEHKGVVNSLSQFCDRVLEIL